LTSLVSVGLAIVLFIQHCPLIYYAYAGFPVFFWDEVIASRETLKKGVEVLMRSDGERVSLMTIASQSILYIGILEFLVSRFRFVTDLRYMVILTEMFLASVLFLRHFGH
jgi:GPI ethanolamine phosphate transferase 1